MKVNFGATWEEAGEAGFAELEDIYSLSSTSTLEEAVANVIAFLGMQPAERTDKVPSGKSSHTLFLAGQSFFLFIICIILIFFDRNFWNLTPVAVLSQ